MVSLLQVVCFECHLHTIARSKSAERQMFQKLLISVLQLRVDNSYKQTLWQHFLPSYDTVRNWRHFSLESNSNLSHQWCTQTFRARLQYWWEEHSLALIKQLHIYYLILLLWRGERNICAQDLRHWSQSHKQTEIFYKPCIMNKLGTSLAT